MAEWPYNTARWKRLRNLHLSLHPLCLDCREIGIVTLASVVDHVHAISNGGAAFPAHEGLRSLCPSCHSQKTARGPEAGAVRTTRARKPRKGCNADGAPIDPRHPWNAQKSLKAGPTETATNKNLELVQGGSDGR
jgi:5-methylcytosine-specific restriction protein A